MRSIEYREATKWLREFEMHVSLKSNERCKDLRDINEKIHFKMFEETKLDRIVKFVFEVCFVD